MQTITSSLKYAYKSKIVFIRLIKNCLKICLYYWLNYSKKISALLYFALANLGSRFSNNYIKAFYLMLKYLPK